MLLRTFRKLAVASALMAASWTGPSWGNNFPENAAMGPYGNAPTPTFIAPSVNGTSAWSDPVSYADEPAVAGGGAPASVSCDDELCADCCSPTWYGQVDALVWWVKGNEVPALVTESPNGTPRNQAGVLGQPRTEILFGDSRIDGNYRPGLRLAVGYWLDDCQTNALEATWFSLGDGANSGNFFDSADGGQGSRVIARPFFNAVLNQQDSQLVAYPLLVGGTIQTQTASEMHSLALLLRHNLSRDCQRHVDLVGGYRFLRFRESLTISERLTSLDNGGLVPVGTTFDVLDSFGTKNDFHGGEFGLNVGWQRGCWDFDLLTKLALGNMHESTNVNGLTVITQPSQAPVAGPGGLLALPTNMGSRSWDDFVMIPELNFNARYQVTDRLSLVAGYTLLWVTDVARTGDQIDTVVNPTQLPLSGGNLIGPARPESLDGSTDLWAQGLNLGVAWEY